MPGFDAAASAAASASLGVRTSARRPCRRRRSCAHRGLAQIGTRSRAVGSRCAGRNPSRPRPARERGASVPRTSSAVPPSSAWMKLACLSDTCAEPSRSPRSPTSSMSAPALTSPGTGLTNTDPAFWPPGWLARRHATISLISASDCGRDRRARAGGPRSSTRSAGRDHSPGTASRGRRQANGRPGGSCPGQIDDGDLDERRGDVRAVPAGVHPHRSADRAGHADGPLEPGQAAGCALPGEHGQRDRRSGPHDAGVDVDLESIGHRRQPTRRSRRSRRRRRAGSSHDRAPRREAR